jgi:hypothetical protein
MPVIMHPYTLYVEISHNHNDYYLFVYLTMLPICSHQCICVNTKFILSSLDLFITKWFWSKKSALRYDYEIIRIGALVRSEAPLYFRVHT